MSETTTFWGGLPIIDQRCYRCTYFLHTTEMLVCRCASRIVVPTVWGDGCLSYQTAGECDIVRCRDCKHGHEVTWPVQLEIPSDYLNCRGYLVETWDYYNDEPKDNPVPPYGFCYWGERRES